LFSPERTDKTNGTGKKGGQGRVERVQEMGEFFCPQRGIFFGFFDDTVDDALSGSLRCEPC
jgi:hypothetical protein